MLPVEVPWTGDEWMYINWEGVDKDFFHWIYPFVTGWFLIIGW